MCCHLSGPNPRCCALQKKRLPAAFGSAALACDSCSLHNNNGRSRGLENVATNHKTGGSLSFFFPVCHTGYNYPRGVQQQQQQQQQVQLLARPVVETLSFAQASSSSFVSSTPQRQDVYLGNESDYSINGSAAIKSQQMDYPTFGTPMNTWTLLSQFHDR